MGEVKQNYKDSVFTKMFGREDKKYLLQLYRALHPDDNKTDTDDLKLVTIENVLTNDIYNDLGFIANGRLVVLVEAQSTWSPNIIARMFIYLARTYQDYIYSDDKIKARLYSDCKIDLPIPEMYVIYTGNRAGKSDVLSLKDEFFKGNSLDIDLKAKVIFADDGRKDIIGQYIAFCIVVKQQLDIHNDKKVAVQEAIRICIENGDLVDYLTSHRKEVEDVMFALLTQEEATKSYGALQRMEAEAEDLKALVNILKNYCKDFDSLFAAVKKDEHFSHLSEEDVRKYY